MSKEGLPQSFGHGVKVFGIAGRMAHERERLYFRMSEEERRWRAQFLKDQILSPNEPRACPEYYRATRNIFRRIINWPLNRWEEWMARYMHPTYAQGTRYTAGKLFWAMVIVYWGVYYAKYNKQEWYRAGGWDFFLTRPASLPGDADFGNTPHLTPEQLYDRGFSKSVLYKKA